MFCALLAAALLPGLSPADDAATDDPFAAIAPMDEATLREASGGSAAYAVGQHAEAVQTNSSDTSATLNGTVSNTTTGTVAENAITGNSGITTVFINSGNNVVLQNTVQVNVYTPTGSAP